MALPWCCGLQARPQPRAQIDQIPRVGGVAFDVAHLEAASAKIPISIPAHKPSRHDWIRVHPAMQITVGAIVLKDDRDEFYLVDPGMVPQLGDDVVLFTLSPFINRLNVLRLWPIRLPNPDGRQNEWHRTAAIAAAMAQRKWIRV